MEQLNLFDIGEFFSDTPMVPVKETPKKANAKAKTASKPAAAEKAKKPKWKVFKLPLRVVGPNFNVEVTKEGAETLTELQVIEELVNMGYAQFKSSNIGLQEITNNVAVSVISKYEKASDDDVVDITVPLTVVRGMTNMEIDSSMFEGKEQGEVTIKDIKDKWIETYPMFEGCLMNYDANTNICYPFFDAALPAKITSFTQIDTDVEENFPTLGDVTDCTYKEVAKALCNLEEETEWPAKISLIVKEVDGKYIVDFQSANGVGKNKEAFKTSSSAKVKKGQKKAVLVTLPVEVNYQVYDPETFTSDDFDGKTKVNLDEIKKKVCALHKAAFNSENGGEFTYFSDVNKIYAAPISAKKG